MTKVFILGYLDTDSLQDYGSRELAELAVRTGTPFKSLDDAMKAANLERDEVASENGIIALPEAVWEAVGDPPSEWSYYCKDTDHVFCIRRYEI